MPTEKVNANPDVLAWARLAAGYDLPTAAKKIGVDPERLRKWETGREQPTLGQLRLLGKVYKRPSAFFFLPEPPIEVPTIPDCRGLPRTDIKNHPKLLYEVRKALERRETALEVIDEFGEEPPTFPLEADMTKSPSVLAQEIRTALGISLEMQYSWKDPYRALNSWISAIENLGVLVFHVSNVDVSEMRGFSLSERPFPVIAVNAQDSPRGRIFTLFHELTHLALYTSGVCDLREPELSITGEYNSVEVYCNRVAGEVLVPADAILQEEIVARNSQACWEDWQLSELADKFMVSQEVILRRLLLLGRTTKWFYEKKRAEYLETYYTRNKTTKGGFLQYHRRILRDNGIAYTSLILSAYYNELISLKELSSFLGGIKLTHIESIERILGGRNG